VWIVPVVLVVLAVLAFVLFGGAGGGGGLLGSGQDDEIPAFDFAQGKTSAVSVSADKKEVPAAAKRAATDITSTLDTLYTEAFLDPANWRDGTYDDVWPLFADAASEAAQQDPSALTVGSGGGAYTKIAQPKGRVQVKILLNDDEQVATAVAVVRFKAIGTRTDGKETVFRSSGQYFLQPGGDAWQVYSFSVDRDDTVREPPPPSSGAASAAAS
jgi:hypothetical protein